MIADRESPPTANEPDREDRWSNILEEIHDASKTGRRWYEGVGVFLAWAAGIGTSVALITLILLLAVDLFSPQRLFNGRTVSDWLFWGSALLLFSGLLAPSASDLKDSTQKRSEKRKKTNFSVTRQSSSSAETPSLSAADRRSDAIRKRLLRVYNPWRWRLWASALVSFRYSMLAGLVA